MPHATFATARRVLRAQPAAAVPDAGAVPDPSPSGCLMSGMERFLDLDDPDLVAIIAVRSTRASCYCAKLRLLGPMLRLLRLNIVPQSMTTSWRHTESATRTMECRLHADTHPHCAGRSGQISIDRSALDRGPRRYALHDEPARAPGAMRRPPNPSGTAATGLAPTPPWPRPHSHAGPSVDCWFGQTCSTNNPTSYHGALIAALVVVGVLLAPMCAIWCCCWCLWRRGPGRGRRAAAFYHPSLGWPVELQVRDVHMPSTLPSPGPPPRDPPPVRTTVCPGG
jgi:hypothetical protein